MFFYIYIIACFWNAYHHCDITQLSDYKLNILFIILIIINNIIFYTQFYTLIIILSVDLLFTGIMNISE